MSIYYDQNEIPGIAQDIVDQEYGGNWGEIKQDLESGDIYRADEKLVYTIQDYMSSHLDTEDEDDEDTLTEELLSHMENKAKTSHRANRKRASLNSTQFDRMVDYIDEVFGMNFYEYGGSLSDVRLLISDVLYNELLIDVSPDDPLVDDFINEWNMFFAGPNKLAQRNPRRANRKRANALFDRLFSSPGVFSVGSSGDIMAYVDLPSDEIPSGGTHFYWVVIDSNGDEIVGGSSSSFEEAKSLAENNLFRLSRELYPESYTSHKANRKTSSDVTNELWFDRDTGDVYEIWIDGNYVVGYGLTFEGGPFTVSEVAGEGVYSPTDFRLQRDGAFSKDYITTWGLVPIDTLEKGQAIEIIERNGYPMPASLGHARDSHRANRKTASEYVQSGVAYTVHSDGSVTEESVAPEWLSVILREDEIEDSGGYYNWSEFEDQLNGSMHSEIVQVGNNGSFINAMHPIDVDDLVALGTGEYMLCSISLEIEDSNGDIERDDMFEYDVIVRL